LGMICPYVNAGAARATIPPQSRTPTPLRTHFDRRSQENFSNMVSTAPNLPELEVGVIHNQCDYSETRIADARTSVTSTISLTANWEDFSGKQHFLPGGDTLWKTQIPHIVLILSHLFCRRFGKKPAKAFSPLSQPLGRTVRLRGLSGSGKSRGHERSRKQRCRNLPFCNETAVHKLLCRMKSWADRREGLP
jgi:hypothetical protein